MESFIRSKYESRRWALEGRPPEDPSVLDTDHPPVIQAATQAQQNIGIQSTPVTQSQRIEPSHRRSMSDGRDDKPLHGPGRTPVQKVDVHPLFREPLQRAVVRALPISANDPLPTPKISIPESVPISLDSPLISTKSEDLVYEPPHRPPTPGSPDRKSPTEPEPVVESLPSESLVVQNPPDHVPPSSEFYTPPDAVGPHDAGDAATTTLYNIGTPLAHLRRHGILIAPRFIFLNFNAPAFGFLIRRAFNQHELPLLIHVIFSSKDEGDIIRCLSSGDDAQTFIDVIDEARWTFYGHHKA